MAKKIDPNVISFPLSSTFVTSFVDLHFRSQTVCLLSKGVRALSKHILAQKASQGKGNLTYVLDASVHVDGITMCFCYKSADGKDSLI